jgi:hypothetical protein
MNAQPFYHRIDGLLFSSTTGFGEQEFIQLLKDAANLKKHKDLGVIIDSIEIEDYSDPEPGDPADLM